MPSQSKPNVNTVWASGGLAAALDAAKQALGWIAEIPDYDQFNGMIQQISQFQKHVNQEGVPAWDALTQYFTNGFAKANGTIYYAKQDNINQAPPALGATNVYWGDLFAAVRDYALDTGAANTYLATFVPAMEVTDGRIAKFKALNTNTGPSTFNGSPILGGAGLALQGGEIIAAGFVILERAGTNWVMVSNSGGAKQVPAATKGAHAVNLDQVNSMLPLRGAQAFTTPGVTPWIVPDGVTKVKVKCIGGGGGGGKRQAITGLGAGGGAGGGGYTEGWLAVTPGASINITVGAGGTGATVQNTAGLPGGASSFGVAMSAQGGPGGGLTGGSGGGLGVGGLYNTSTGTGQGGIQFSNSATTDAGLSGAGGGAGGNGTTFNSGSPSSNGAAGYGPGGGGAGAVYNGNGGAGFAGLVTIEW